MGKNKCFGCKYYGGVIGSLVQCDNGQKGVFFRDGCSHFTPDITASCCTTELCFYNKSRRIVDDIECSIHGFLKDEKKYCYDFAKKWEEKETRSSSKSGCFVTTAVCDILGKDDKCFELETLRKFRDDELLPDSELKKLVFEYYEISPRLVNKIMNHEDKHQFANNLLNEHINVIIKTIHKGDKSLAVKLYQNMLLAVEEAK